MTLSLHSADIVHKAQKGVVNTVEARPCVSARHHTSKAVFGQLSFNCSSVPGPNIISSHDFNLPVYQAEEAAKGSRATAGCDGCSGTESPDASRSTPT